MVGFFTRLPACYPGAMSTVPLQRLGELWDELAELGSSQVERLLERALEQGSELMGAQQAFWMGTVRLGDRGDPVGGWRPAQIRYLRPRPELEAAFAENRRRIDQGDVDPTIVRNILAAGRFRVSLQSDLLPPDWDASEFRQRFFEQLGVRDMIYAVTPLGEDLESWLGFQRLGREGPLFGEDERSTLEAFARPLRWLHRCVALHHGLLLAESPVTPSERRVVSALLGAQSEKEIAASLGLSPATVHTYANRLYRKFGVSGRAGLTALWLGGAPERSAV
jgi:DNA-binding CsgD family transcriptional regulator